MPIYNVDGETYNISDKEVKAFENDFPNAKVRYSVDGEDYDIAINEREDFLKDFPNAKYSSLPKQKSNGMIANTVNAENGMTFTEAGLDSLEKGATPVYVEEQRDFSQPMDLSRPEEYKVPEHLLHPYAAEAEQARQTADSADLNRRWAKAQEDMVSELVNPNRYDIGQRMDFMREAQRIENARRTNRSEFDAANQQRLDDLYNTLVSPVLSEERAAGEQRAQAEIRSMQEEPQAPQNVSGAMTNMGQTFKAAVASERETDPAKIAANTIKRVQGDDAFGDYVLSRMGINGQTVDDNGSSPQLEDWEKEQMKRLFGIETSEVADLMIQRIYNQYKAEGAPTNTLEYITSKAFRENFAASLFDSMVRRAAGSSGIREQLRAIASEEYGQSLDGIGGWTARMAAGAAPFAVDMLTGGFAAANAVGSALVKGGMRLAAKEVTKEMSKRAAARGLEGTALKEAVAGSAEVAERYIATQAPILNFALRTAGSAANFATYETQTEAIRQYAEGQFDAASLIGQAVHGAALGSAVGAVGGMVAHATRYSSLATKVAADVASLGAETGIFAAANGIAKAQQMGINITDVDWASTTGEAFGTVLGMKGVGAVMHPKTFGQRYSQSKDLGLQFNQRDVDELKAAGYDMSDIFKGLGAFGDIAPQEANVVRRAAEYMVDANGKRTQRNTETQEAYVDREAFENLLNDPNVSSSVKRKVTYIATGQVLNLEPAFAVEMDVNQETGIATITTKNAYGNPIETKDYQNLEEAQQDFDAAHELALSNTIGGLERIADKVGFEDVKDIAKSRTMEETGVDVDNLDQLSDLDTAAGNKVLEAYAKNLQDSYMERFNENLERLSAMEGIDTTDPVERSERRQAAYDRGVTVGSDETQLPQVRYDSKVAEARMMQQMPDGSQQAYIRKQIMDAVQSDDLEGAERTFALQSPYLSDQQREAVEDYLDSAVASYGVSDAIQQNIEDYEQEVRQLIEQQSDEQGFVTPLTLKDGSTVYFQSGDLNGFRSNVFVVTADGETKQISTKDIVEVGTSTPSETLVASQVERYSDGLTSRYNALSDGSLLYPGQQTDIVMGSQLFHITALGTDDMGNNVIQMEDGSRMAMTPEQTAEAVDAADYMKIQQLLGQEQEAETLRQRTLRFTQGIKGYDEGTPMLAHKDTKPEVAAEYLLSQTDDAGQPVERSKVMADIQQEIDNNVNGREKALQALQQAKNDLAMAAEDSEEARKAQAVIDELEPFVTTMEQHRRKWGEIRQAMMTDEERQAFEKDRTKAISKSREQSKKDMQPAADAAGVVAIPTKKEVVQQYPERTDGESFVEEQRKQLSQAYRQDVYPKYDDIQKQLDDYQHGLIDLTADELKALTDQQAVLSQQMTQMVEQVNAWKKLGSDIAKAYAAAERQQMTPYELAMSNIAKESDKQKKLKLAREAFKDDEDALAVLDNLEPQDVYEYVADNLGKGSINWEGLQRGEHTVRGLISEMGKDKKRGIGAGFDTNGYNYFLAPEGQGKGIDEVIHAIAESSPYDTEQVREALLSMLKDAQKPTDISHRIIDDRIAQADQLYNERLEREREAELQNDVNETQEDAENDVSLQQTISEVDSEIGARPHAVINSEADMQALQDAGVGEEYLNRIRKDMEDDTTVARYEKDLGMVILFGEKMQRLGMTPLQKKAADYHEHIHALKAYGYSEQDIADIAHLIEFEYPEFGFAVREDHKDQDEEVQNEEIVAYYIQGNIEDGYLPNMLEGAFEDNNGDISTAVNNIFNALKNGRKEEASVQERGAGAERQEESELVSQSEISLQVGENWDAKLAQLREKYPNVTFIIHHADTDAKGMGVEVSGTWELRGQDAELVQSLMGPFVEMADDGTIRIDSDDKLTEVLTTLVKNGHKASVIDKLQEKKEKTRITETVGGTNGNSEPVLKEVTVLDGNPNYSEEEQKSLKYVPGESFEEYAKRNNSNIYQEDMSRLYLQQKYADRLDEIAGIIGNLTEDNAGDAGRKIGAMVDDRAEGYSMLFLLNKINTGAVLPFYDGVSEAFTSFPLRLKRAKDETDTNPTEAQKIAGNYKMGHISFGGYRMSIETPKGAVRSGKDANGRPWSIEMQDTYGYIGKKYGADKDHLDFFVNDDVDLDNWNGRVYVIDQKNGDGSFDEHKVMYGYPSWSAARKAYERNYEAGWWDKHVMQMTGMKKADFDKWLADSDHKKKPFAEYSRTKNAATVSDPMEQLMADVDERKNMQPDADATGTVAVSFKDGELEKKTIAELEQARKKKQQDLSTSRYILGTTNVQKGGLKERTLKQNIAQAEADIAAIDKVLEQKRKAAPTDLFDGIDFMIEDIAGEPNKISPNAFKFGNNFVSLQTKEAREVVDGQKATLPKTAPWRDGVEDVIVHTTLGNIRKKHAALHERAKAGDIEAAEELVNAVAKPEKVKALAEQHPNAKVAFVHAEEATGRNQIPAQYAGLFEDAGLSLADIVQTNKPAHTGSDRLGRFVRRSRFGGDVEAGAEYIIVDDHVTMGSTLRDLKDYIESKGGKVVAVSTLTASAGGTKLRPTEEQIKELTDKGISNEQLKELGIADSIDGLTRREAAEVLVLADRGGDTGTSQRPEALFGSRQAVEGEAPSAGDVAKEETYYFNVGDKFHILFNGAPHDVEVVGVDGEDLLVNVDDMGNMPIPADILTQYVRDANDPKSAVDKILDETERRREAAEDQQEAGDAVQQYLSQLPKKEVEKIRQRATKAVLASLDNAKVPYKVVSKREERDMMRLFSTMNKEAVKVFARNDRMRTTSPHGNGRYIVYNMSNPFGVPMYSEKMSVAKEELEQMKRLIPEGDWAIMDIGLPGEPVEENAQVRRAAEYFELMQMMGGNKKASEPAVPRDESPFKATAISNADAKVINNLEELVKKSENFNPSQKKDFLKSLSEALGAERQGSGSRYVTIEAKNGTVVTLRLADHNVTVSRFDYSGEPNGVSIVVSRKPNEGITNDGNAHIVEYFYPDKELRKADGNPYAEIVKSVEQMLYSGEYKDNTGIAQPEEVNSFDDLELMMGWHGSGAQFDKFDHRHMGSGEGNQSFGWGTYITEVEGIGRMYAESMGGRRQPATYKGVTSTSIALMSEDEYKKLGAANEAQRNILASIVGSCNFGYGDPVRMIRVKRESLQEQLERKLAVIEDAKEQLEEEKDQLDEKRLERLNNRIRINEKIVKETQELLAFVNGLDSKDFKGWSKPNGSFLYKVDIPEDTGDNYFDWTEHLTDAKADELLAEVREILLANKEYGWNGQEAKLDKQLEAMKSFFGGAFYGRMAVMLGNSVAGAAKKGQRMASELLSKHGYVGIKYPAEYMSGGREDGAKNYVIFNEDDAKITDTIQFMMGGTDADASGTVAPTFYSNALRAVESIKQEKGTPEQWLKMIEKNGGLKAGEDKWIQLSEWLNELKETGVKSVAKESVLEYVRQHQIEIEEVHYSENANSEGTADKAVFQFTNNLTKEAIALSKDKGIGVPEASEQLLTERYGDNWDEYLEVDSVGIIRALEFIASEDIAEALNIDYDGKAEKPVHSTRLDYTTEGLKNKREIALTVPSVEPYNEDDEIHFGDAGRGRAVAWVRFGETSSVIGRRGKELKSRQLLDEIERKYGTTNEEQLPDDARAMAEEAHRLYREAILGEEEVPNDVLVIDEIQSKRHQDGREMGYGVPVFTKATIGEYKPTDEETEFEADIIAPNGNKIGTMIRYEYEDEPVSYSAMNNNGTHMTSARPTEQEALTAMDHLSPKGVPEAPFEKNWHELAMKRMLRYAAENGYDKIAWTTGDQQAERYDLGGVIDSINAYQHSDPMTGEVIPEKYDVFVKDKRGGYIHEQGMEGVLTKEQILQNFGKDLGARIIKEADEHPDGTAEISGDGLRIGGDGMKGFYDEILVRFMNKYGKKWGVQVQDVDLPEIGQKMHVVDVTPEMKESVMQGQPMFHNHGKQILGWTDGAQIFLTQAGLNPNTPLHETTHLWDKWCQKEEPELWHKMVWALKQTQMWEDIASNPNYRSIWNDENRMASEVHSRLTGSKGEEEFMKAAFKKGTTQKIIDEVKSVLRKFWERILQLFGKKTKTVGSDWDSLDAIIRMPIRDLLNMDFEKVMRVARESGGTAADMQAQRGEAIRKTLMGVHNISEEKLKKAIKAGGLANPSLAVVDTDKGIHTAYGEISLIPTSDLIDSKTGNNAGTFAGDAYTPTYPYVQRMVTKQGEKSIERIAKEAAGGDEELARHLRNNLYDYAEGNASRLHLLYLIQKGLNPEIRQERIAHSKKEFDAITKIFGEPMSTMPNRESITKEQNDALADLMVSVYEKKLRDGIDPEKPLTEKMQNYLDARVEEYRKNLLDDDGYIWFANGDNFIHDNWRDEKRRQNPQPDWYGTDNDASYRIAKEGLSEDYEKWKEEQLFGDGDFEEKLFAGYDRDGNRKYLPNTVENASRLMNRHSDTNAYDQGGLNATKSSLLKRMSTLSDIRKNKYLLQSKEAYDKSQKEASDELFDIIHQLSDMQKISDNPYSNIDYAEARLQEAITKRDPIGYLNKEYGYDIDKDGEYASQVMNFIEAARNLPAKYFETKFKRPVRLSEFAIAIVPETTSKEVVDALKSAGLEVHTYEAGGHGDENDANRAKAVMDAIGMRDDIMFHIEDDPNTLDWLDKEETETGYRNVVMNEDGTLGSPMASRLGKTGEERKATTPFEYGKWERSDEHPELANEQGKIDLIKPNGKPVGGVDYNPYIHIRPNKVNKQFKEAWRRPELIYVETEYPKSELEGGYQAEKAAKAVGRHPWGNKGEELILSRWDKPVRMVPWEEVADDWEKEFAGRGVEFDIIPPALLPILAERGVEILPPHKGCGKECQEAYEKFKAELAAKPQEIFDLSKTKCVDDNGEPLVVYRGGTAFDENTIKNASETAMYGKAFYATPSIGGAEEYAIERTGDKKNIQAVYIDVRNPFVDGYVDGFNHPDPASEKEVKALIDLLEKKGLKDAKEWFFKWKNGKINGSLLGYLADANYEGLERPNFAFWHASGIVQEALKELGYDGVIGMYSGEIFRMPQVAVFDMKQVKSAEAENDIRRSRGQRLEAHDTTGFAEAAAAAGEKLGGIGVQTVTYDKADANMKAEIDAGTKGIFNPNTGEVTLLLDNIENVDDAVRTVFHEKLGHEGLVALLGSQEEVNKFGTFVFRSAGKTLRQRIMEKADEIDPQWTKGNRFSEAAQEVMGDIAADGPRTDEEFSLWTKVKHYLIRLCNKIGLRIRGLLNDKDLTYYIVKTGEALKRWNKMSEEEKAALARQAEDYDILRSRHGKPRKRNNESDAQYFQRLREWEKWRAARQTAKDNGDPEPEEVTFHEQAEADFKADLQEWKERNGIPAADATGVGAYPRRQDGESPQEFAMRIAEYEAQSDLWKTAPKLMDYLAEANSKYRQAYTEWRERYDLQEQESVDQRLYEGDVDTTPTFTDADMEAEALAEKDFAEAVGMEVDEAGAKRHAKLAVIERRKNMESANAEDAIWIYDLVKMTDAVAAEIDDKATGKELRAALPFLIEADRRKENLEAAREDAVMVINMSDAIQNAHSFIDYRNLSEIDSELRELNDAWQYQVARPTPENKLAYRAAAARLAEKLNQLNKDLAGYNNLYADDVMQIRSLLTSASVAGMGNVIPESAQRFMGIPEVQQLIDHIKEWYDEFYQVIEDAGLRGDAGYIEEGYVNHVWDKEKSDPKAWEKYIENRQRTKSPNMRHREIDTYMDGIEIGLAPKYTDIADMIAHYSRQNNEAVANRRFLDDLQFVVVEEMNDAGEVTAILPLIEFDKPSSFVRERYTQYYVPGCGDVYVLKHIQKRFANIFGTMRTSDAADWLSNMAKGYDLTSSTAKKIQLAMSGFHALALFEVDMAQNNPANALKHLFKYIIADSVKAGTLPAYAHPEDFQLAAKHLVQLGATEDYAAADVNAITQKMRDTFKEWSMSDEAWKKAIGVAGSPAAIMMDWINKRFDTVLWNYLHDGLKLSAFKELAKQVDRRVEKQGLDESTREQLLDEAGQYVNDMFGGQYWELINVSPATLKWMRRAFLSPDWLISTQRHFFANFGFGSVYSDSGFRNYIKYNADNIKRLFGADVAHDELRRLRSKNAKYCYLIGAAVWWGLFYNAINALCRWKDEKEEQAKAEEMRKTNPSYKSPYELAYPDGMKWYDYTMYGNSIGQNTHLFTGRYADGTETYVRWGKQFREFPELFIGRHGLEFPAPIIQRMMSKANPNIGTAIDFLGAQNIGGFNGSYENKELREKYGKTVATLASIARHFIPFGMPTQAEKEYKWLDFFMPSSKGFSRWKAKDYFETFILDGDWDGIEQTYNACVMNGIDAEKNLVAAIKSIEAAQRKELVDGITDLTTATQKFDEATDPDKRKLYLNKIKKYLKDGEYKVFTREEAVEKVKGFLDGDNPSEKENTRYVMLATSEDIIAEEKLKDLGRKAGEFKKKIEEAEDDKTYKALEKRYGVWLDISDIISEAKSSIKESKEALGQMDEDKIMEEIRKTIKEANEEINKLNPPK